MTSFNSLHTVRYFFQKYPRRTFATLMALLAAGLLEGIGIMTVLPLISILVGGEEKGGHGAEILEQMYGFVGLDLTLINLLFFIVLVMSLKALVSLGAFRVVADTVAYVTYNLRQRLIQALLNAKWHYFAQHPIGKSANAISAESIRAGGSYQTMCQSIANGIQAIVYLGIALTVSWKITVAGILVGIIGMTVLRPLVRVSFHAGLKQTELLKQHLPRLIDVLNGIKPIKAMNSEKTVGKFLEKEILDLKKAQMKQSFMIQALSVLQEPILVATLSFGMWVILSYTTMKFTELMFVGVVFYRLVSRINNIQNAYQNMTIQESALWSLLEGISEAEAQKEKRTGQHKPTFKKSLQAQNISFSYGQKQILKNVSLTIPVGKFVAIMGPSGAGKTTLVDLITGLQQPDAGEILLDNMPLSQVRTHQWRQMIGYVPQEVLLLHTTIYENITLSDTSITKRNVETALKKAGAWAFISQLPEGIHTVVGERGSKLSGGERQRIAIARALVRTPKLLILDEATSALDPKTETAILKTVKTLTPTMTVLAISHSKAVVKVAQQTYKIQNGKLKKT